VCPGLRATVSPATGLFWQEVVMLPGFRYLSQLNGVILPQYAGHVGGGFVQNFSSWISSPVLSIPLPFRLTLSRKVSMKFLGDHWHGLEFASAVPALTSVPVASDSRGVL
jgi:hypothetical protein